MMVLVPVISGPGLTLPQEPTQIAQQKTDPMPFALRRFKLEMNWNQEELEQWAIAARQKEEDQPEASDTTEMCPYLMNPCSNL